MANDYFDEAARESDQLYLDCINKSKKKVELLDEIYRRMIESDEKPLEAPRRSTLSQRVQMLTSQSVSSLAAGAPASLAGEAAGKAESRGAIVSQASCKNEVSESRQPRTPELLRKQIVKPSASFCFPSPPKQRAPINKRARDTTPNFFRGESPKKSAKKVKTLVLNHWNTIYPVVRKAAETCGFRPSNKDHQLRPNAETLSAHRLAPGMFTNIKIEDFDVVWFDLAIEADVVKKLKPYQRINQWPGISVLSDKSKLAHNLKLMHSHFPADFDFFPQTYLLPEDW